MLNVELYIPTGNNKHRCLLLWFCYVLAPSAESYDGTWKQNWWTPFLRMYCFIVFLLLLACIIMLSIAPLIWSLKIIVIVKVPHWKRVRIHTLLGTNMPKPSKGTIPIMPQLRGQTEIPNCACPQCCCQKNGGLTATGVRWSRHI